MVSEKDTFIIYTGTYGLEEDYAIQVLAFNTTSRSFKQLNSVKGIANPSYLAVNRKQDTLYVISEEKQGKVACYDIIKDMFRLEEKGNLQDGEIVGPCYITLDESEQYLFVVNYAGGSLLVYQLASYQTIEKLTDQHVYLPGSHPHMIIQIPNTSRYIVTDLGLDKVYLYELNKGKLTLINEFATTSKSGPRHVAVFGEHRKIYIVNEFNSQIAVYNYDETCSKLELVQEINVLNETFNGKNFGADIHIAYERSFLYTSNRGHDSISVFKINNNGLLTYIDNVSAEGKWPRNFVITPDETTMLVANQHTNAVVAMEIQAEGVPKYTGNQFSIEAPVCLKSFDFPSE
ncbi:lactonase family protein [Paraliobacillus salinarum]|uniref:lactonase family protein n=1 Tax=Paraliobacillus salinarum TaxID=1158996 RepID=UPI0015F56009|nr:lactonase family protein [Paraliobacillus salinarum]